MKSEWNVCLLQRHKAEKLASSCTLRDAIGKNWKQGKKAGSARPSGTNLTNYFCSCQLPIGRYEPHPHAQKVQLD